MDSRLPQKIELLVLTDYGATEVLKQKGVSIEIVKEIMMGLDWDKFHQVVLSRSKQDWIEVGGNLGEDGLAAVYQEKVEIFVTDEAPASVEQMIDIVVSYIKDDGVFKAKYKFSGESDTSEKDEEPKQDFNKWNDEFKIKRKKTRLILVKRWFLLSFAVLVLGFVAYNWYTGELQFIGQKTEFTKARVVKTHMHHIGRGYYKQTVTYEFEYNEAVYLSTFEAGKREGRHSIGDVVKIKFSINDPSRSIRVGTYP